MEGFKESFSTLFTGSYVHRTMIPPAYAHGELTWGSVAETLIRMESSLSRAWVKGSLYTMSGMCMYGAYIYGSGAMKRSKDGLESRIIGELLEDAIRLDIRADIPPFHHSWNAVVFFNDIASTTHQDVLRAVRTAVKIAHGLEDAGADILIPSLTNPSTVTNYLSFESEFPIPESLGMPIVDELALMPAGV